MHVSQASLTAFANPRPGAFGRVGGAMRLPAVVALWVAAITVALFELESADAMLPLGDPLLAAPASVFHPANFDIDLIDQDALQNGLRRHSDVVSGRWHPEPAGLTEEPTERLVRPAVTEPERGVVEISEVQLPVVVRRVLPAPVPAVVSGTMRKVPVAPADAAPSGRWMAAKARARSELRAGRFGAAYALLRPQVGTARRDSEYLGLLALAALHLGHREEAAVLYRHLAALEPAVERWHTGLAAADPARRSAAGPALAVAGSD